MARFTGGSSTPMPTAVIPDAILFVAGPQLWRTDGTQAGTVPVRRFSSTQTTSSIVSLGGRVVFAASDGGWSSEPWVSDGTASGTKLLRDIAPGVASSGPAEFFVADGLAYFTATDPIHGRELWQTDGTSEGTLLVADLASGPASSTPGRITRFRNTLYFAAGTPGDGRELWAYPLPDAPALQVGGRARDGEREADHDSRPPHARIFASSQGRLRDRRRYGRGTPRLHFRERHADVRAGQTVHSIDVGIADDATSGPTRAFALTLKDATVPVQRIIGAGIIDDDDRVADLSLTLDFDPYGLKVNIRNAGPDAASNVVFCSVTNGERLCSTDLSIENGQSRSHAISPSAFLEASVQSFELDPNSSNNSLSMHTTLGGAVVATPAVARAGQSGTLFVRRWLLAEALVVSDPTVVSVVPPGSEGADLYASTAFTALRPGSATIAFGTYRVTIRVIGPDEDRRGKASLVISYPVLRFGDESMIKAEVGGVRSDGKRPTGTFSLFVDGVFAGSGAAGTSFPTSASRLRPGEHEAVIRYSGDTNFLDEVGTWTLLVRKGLASLRATASEGRLTIQVFGADRSAPTGTIAIDGISHALIATGPVTAEVTIELVSPAPRTIAFSYSGDTLYEAATVTLPIEGPRTRRTRH